LFAIGFKCGYLNFHWVHLCFVIAVLWGRNAANPGNDHIHLVAHIGITTRRDLGGIGLLGKMPSS
jgi:hypothetical protein